MSCHCGGQCRTCGKMAAGATGSNEGPLTGSKNNPPVNFPSARQARLAVGSHGPGGVPHQPRWTKERKVPSTSGQGQAVHTVGTAPWSVPAPNWGSHGTIRWGQLIKNRFRHVIDYLPFRADLAPQDGTPRVRRKGYPALDEKGYNLKVVTDQQVMALAAARAKARQKASGG